MLAIPRHRGDLDANDFGSGVLAQQAQCGACDAIVYQFLQAATQLQEQTFAYALKFLTIVVMLFVTASLIGGSLYTYANHIFTSFPSMVRDYR